MSTESIHLTLAVHSHPIVRRNADESTTIELFGSSMGKSDSSDRQLNSAGREDHVAALYRENMCLPIGYREIPFWKSARTQILL